MTLGDELNIELSTDARDELIEYQEEFRKLVGSGAHLPICPYFRRTIEDGELIWANCRNVEEEGVKASIIGLLTLEKFCIGNFGKCPCYRK